MKNLNLYALANELNIGDPKSGTIRVPFGRWDFGAKKLDDGRTVFFVQELTRDGAERMAAKINAGVADGEKGVPVYWGHPDVPELAHKYPDKRAKGWIKSAAVEADALVLSVEWLEEHATDGFGWFSPFWGGPAKDLGQGRYLKQLDSLTSVALVNIPNIQEFRLANELQGGVNNNETGAIAGEGEKKMDRAKLIQALGLPETATDEDIFAAIEKNKAAAADAATKQAAAEAEKGQAEKDRDEAKTELANERAAHRALLLDQAIAEGRISVAGRAAWDKRLTDDFAAGKVALANEKPLKTETAVTTTPGKQASVDLVALANERMAKHPGMTYPAAFAQVMKEHPEVK
jgi:hypothetical protein